VNVKRDARQRFADQERTGKYLPHYALSITYDVESVGSTTSAEIGPDKAKVQGAFGPGVEYGSVQHAPMPHLNPALDAEEPKFLNALGDAVVRVLG
jgi:hypothetical protein